MKVWVKRTLRNGILAIFLLASCLGLVTGCTTDTQIEATVLPEMALTSPQTESTSPAQSQTPASAAIPTAAPTITPSPTITPTPNPLLNAVEQISLFSTYDDFTGPFDPTRWDIEEPDENNPFNYSTENGSLTVHMDPDQFGYTQTTINVPPAALSGDINGVSVVLPSNEETDGQTPHGLRVGLTNGKNQWTYTCTYHLDSSNFSCELEDAASHATLYRMHNISVSQYLDLVVQVAWIPETGLLLTFLNGQLADYQTLTVVEPISAEKAGLFVSRDVAYASGIIVFSNFRIGTYQETDLNLPDDLLPHWENQYLLSSNNIDFYLYDDFDQPLYDGYIDLRRWKLHYDEERKSIADNKTVFGQQDGRLIFEGSTDVILVPIQSDDNVQGMQVDFIPQDKKFTDSLLVMSLTIRQPASGDGYGQLIYEYACRIESKHGENKGIFCGFYGSGDNDTYYVSSSMPINTEETITANLSYDDTTGSFMLFLNEFLVDKIQVEDRYRQVIEQQGIIPWMQINQNQNGRTVLDNFAVGIKSDTVSDMPAASTGDVVAILPHSDLYLFDDFEDRQFDGSWQIANWDSNLDNKANGGLYQMDGRLLVGEFPQTAHGAWQLYTKGYYKILDQNTNAVQIEFGPQPNAYNEHIGFILGINAEKFNQYLISRVPTRDDLEHNGVSCGVNYLGAKAFVECGVCFESLGCVDYNSTPILDKVAIDPFSNHILAIEYDQSTNTYSVYLDRQRITEFQSSANPFTRHVFLMQGGGNGDMGASVYIDNVLLGVPAEHPDALSLPEEPLQPLGLDSELRFMQTVETSPYTRFFSPYDVNLGINSSHSGWNFEGDYEARQDNLLVIREDSIDHHVLLPKFPGDTFTLSQINAASITLEPVDSPSYGWQTELALNSERGTFHFRCYLHYETQDSHFACQGYDEDRGRGYQSEHIAIDPGIQHQFSFEVEPETYIFHVLLDGTYVFDVDVTEYADLLPESRYQLYIVNEDLEGSGVDYQMRIIDFWEGTPKKD